MADLMGYRVVRTGEVIAAFWCVCCVTLGCACLLDACEHARDAGSRGEVVTVVTGDGVVLGEWRPAYDLVASVIRETKKKQATSRNARMCWAGVGRYD